MNRLSHQSPLGSSLPPRGVPISPVKTDDPTAGSAMMPALRLPAGAGHRTIGVSPLSRPSTVVLEGAISAGASDAPPSPTSISALMRTTHLSEFSDSSALPYAACGLPVSPVLKAGATSAEVGRVVKLTDKLSFIGTLNTHGEPSGPGILQHQSYGKLYDGHWENGVPSGAGTFFHRTFSRYLTEPYTSVKILGAKKTVNPDSGEFAGYNLSNVPVRRDTPDGRVQDCTCNVNINNDGIKITILSFTERY